MAANRGIAARLLHLAGRKRLSNNPTSHYQNAKSRLKKQQHLSYMAIRILLSNPPSC
ncbi:hypothetical protein [Spartinivicinus poritis]|uniref:Uncharacterized protein n=1 Tax=Spartinivicinus poritis TaxID=2994640 RepID=A0ABT5U9E9_9GAMM|nr:hypothetical protein [Spartinivicinus sp. A2-2]MDE1463001.1 hypothetical protein [Spartinivicinus sp. A2-2]